VFDDVCFFQFPASMKTTKGRVAMTTGPAIKGTEGSAPTIETESVGRSEVPSTQSTMGKLVDNNLLQLNYNLLIEIFFTEII
jgi:hypothetical protein